MFTQQKKLLTSCEYKTQFPLTDDLRAVKERLDAQLKDNLTSRKRLMVVCGPCSADYPAEMEIYLERLRSVAAKCTNLFVVARIYTSKPHSNGVGYKGTAFHLANTDAVDLNEGIARCRQMMLYCLKSGLPVADELLYPELLDCFSDLVSYWFVGARSSEDTFHRNFASGLDVCCGVKNATDGSIEKVVDSLFAIGNPCVFPYNGFQVSTNGCKYAHIVLRGGQKNGAYFQNISANDVKNAKSLLKKRGLNDFVMADLNHANSGKIAVNQINNAQIALNSGADGIMIESYIKGGGNSAERGISQTDDCLDFAATEKLLQQLDAAWKSKRQF